MRRTHEPRIGWVPKLVATLAVIGLLAFDGVSLLRARLTGADQANTAANAAAENYKATHDIQQAYNAGLAALNGDRNDTIETATFRVDSAGVVTLRLHRHATTLIVHRIPPLRFWEDAVETGVGTPSF